MELQHRFSLHENLDVLDTFGKWCNAQIVKINGQELYLWYTEWSSKYNQWVPTSSLRILKQWVPGRPIQINNRLDVMHHLANRWLEARVYEVNGDMLKVHFYGFHPKHDLQVNINNRQLVAPVGAHSKASGVGKKRGKQVSKISAQILNKLKNLNLQFKESLKSQKLVVKQIRGDGNCMFRTISDQLYGTEDNHRQLREFIMDYILYERDFFKDYIEEDIEDYVAKKKLDGVWGDDVQLQAISQIYNRPIEVYVNQDKPIRTFHEDNEGNILPIRIAYQGSCHYNSIKEEGYDDLGIMQDKFPTWQDYFMQNLQNNKYAQEVYRSQFANKGTIDETVNTVMNGDTKETLELERQMIKVTETDTLLDEIEKCELKQATIIQQEARVQQQMRRIQEMELEQIKRQSLKDHEKAGKAQRGMQQQLWIQNIREQGFSDKEILLAISVKGNNPNEVLNYLYDNC